MTVSAFSESFASPSKEVINNLFINIFKNLDSKFRESHVEIMLQNDGKYIVPNLYAMQALGHHCNNNVAFSSGPFFCLLDDVIERTLVPVDPQLDLGNWRLYIPSTVFGLCIPLAFLQ